MQRIKSVLSFIGLVALAGLLLGATIEAGKLIVTIVDPVELMGYTTASDSNRAEEIDPLDGRYLNETIVDVTNGTDGGGPGGGGEYYYYIDMNSSRKAGYQIILDCVGGTVTATLEGTFQDDDTAPAACAYETITNDTFGVMSLIAAAGAATDIWADNSEKLALFKYVRIVIAAATGGNTGDWAVFKTQLY